MEFKDILIEIETKNNFKTHKKLYEYLGSENRLGIKYRHFAELLTGKAYPSEKVLLAVFNKTEPHNYAKLLVAYITTSTRKANSPTISTKLINYVEEHLSPGISVSKDGLWSQTSKKFDVYTEEQLDGLCKDEHMLKLHKKILLYEKIPTTSLSTRDRLALAQLVKMSLSRIEGQYVKPSAERKRLPTTQIAPPKLVAAGTRYILKNIDAYVAQEDSADQQLNYTYGLFEPEIAELVLKQMEAFNKWIQKSMSAGTEGHLIPLVYVGFGKRLTKEQM